MSWSFSLAFVRVWQLSTRLSLNYPKLLNIQNKQCRSWAFWQGIGSAKSCKLRQLWLHLQASPGCWRDLHRWCHGHGTPAWPRRAVKTLSNVASRSPPEKSCDSSVEKGQFWVTHMHLQCKTENLTKIGRCQRSPELVKVLQHLRHEGIVCLQILNWKPQTKYLLDSWAVAPHPYIIAGKHSMNQQRAGLFSSWAAFWKRLQSGSGVASGLRFVTGRNRPSMCN